MAEPSSAGSGRQSLEQGLTKAPKDKNCPYCGQAFTSSSLGRHLDLYIKEKNPKPPDGLHDVHAIRKVRGGITRRQPRGSIARKDGSTPGGTPTAASKRSGGSEPGSPSGRSPATAKNSQQGAETFPRSTYPFIAGWEATGVINDIPSKDGEVARSGQEDGPQDAARRPLLNRQASRQMAKAQFDMKQRVQDAIDTARASELALRELLSSWRAAKHQIDTNTMPFEFDPLSLDFPAITLQCLQPPPTLFSSTQHPTPTSWSIAPPGETQFLALQSYFQEEFRKWKISCAAATTSVMEDMTYPPTDGVSLLDTHEAVKQAEEMADSLEQQVAEHLRSAYVVWESLPAERRGELWQLELARAVGRKQKDLDRLRNEKHGLRQEVANLKSQVEHLNRLQQPREFKILPPSTIHIEENMIQYMLEQGVVKGRRAVGLKLDDRHLDLNTVVSTAIERWKNVILSTRASTAGMNAQRSLNSPLSAPPGGLAGPHNLSSAGSSVAVGGGSQPQPQIQRHVSVPMLQQPPQPQAARHMSAGSAYARAAAAATAASSAARSMPEATAASFLTTTTTAAAAAAAAAVRQAPTAPTSISATASEPGDSAASSASSPSEPSADEISDEDADAEMEEDDTFPPMNTHINNHQPQMMTQQYVHMQQQQQRQRQQQPQHQSPQLQGSHPGGSGSISRQRQQQVLAGLSGGQGRAGGGANMAARPTASASTMNASRHGGGGSSGGSGSVGGAEAGIPDGGGGGSGGEPMYMD